VPSSWRGSLSILQECFADDSYLTFQVADQATPPAFTVNDQMEALRFSVIKTDATEK
jgi:hypothetical protein